MSSYYSNVYGSPHASHKATGSEHKCPGCGSHEFREHHGAKACVWCRTVVGTTVATSAIDSDISWLKFQAQQAKLEMSAAWLAALSV